MTSLTPLLRRFERRRRFWRHVDVGRRDECWPWTGPVDAAGVPVYDHRPAAEHAWRLARGGRPPVGTALRHTCGNRACVNPEHVTF
jgi:hypothetical protein